MRENPVVLGETDRDRIDMRTIRKPARTMIVQSPGELFRKFPLISKLILYLFDVSVFVTATLWDSSQPL